MKRPGIRMGYEPTKAGRLISEFVNDNLSNWYVRLNRKRFWGGGMTQDKLSAFQTLYLISDLRFLQELEPDMIGIGPYLTHAETPFHIYGNGSFELTLKLISILRIMFPYALIPATTALGTINPLGREMGLKAGANVVMPNLSPVSVRKFYELYENKICTGDESAQCRSCLEKRVSNSGYSIVTDIRNVKK